MNYLNTISTCLLICLSINLQAQEFPYFLSVENEPYEELVDSISLTEDEVWDDPELTVEIGFDFEMFDQTFTDLYFFGTGGSLTGTIEITETYLYFVPYFSDIIDRGYGTNFSHSSINYKLDGTPGSQVLTIEWKNVGFYNEMDELGTMNDYVNFQVRLYEGSNDIEIHFGPKSIQNPQIAHEGSQGPAILFAEEFIFTADEPTFDIAHLLVGQPDSATVEQIFDLSEGVYTLDADPNEGTLFRFTTSAPTSTKGNNMLKDALQVCPTLVNNLVQIKLSEQIDINNSSIQVMNELGQVLQQQNMRSNQERMDLSKLSAGIYFIRVQTDGGVASARVVKG